MGIVLITKESKELSSKTRSLEYLHQLNLPLAPTIIVPEYKAGDTVPITELGPAEFYYIRLCFRDNALGRSEWRVTQSSEVEMYLEKLATISESNAADLLVQPFFHTSYSGAVLKAGAVVFVEIAYGLAPTLLHRGRFSYRAILVNQQVVFSEVADQGVAVIWGDKSPTTVQERGWDRYDPRSVVSQIANMIAHTDNILFEWGIVNESLAFFDHKEIDASSGFFELKQLPPRIPRSVTAMTNEIETSSLPRKVLFLDYPDINALSQAQAADYVVIKRGAILSHLSIYSMHKNYKCAFLE